MYCSQYLRDSSLKEIRICGYAQILQFKFGRSAVSELTIGLLCVRAIMLYLTVATT